jgi:hypothetical protein
MYIALREMQIFRGKKLREHRGYTKIALTHKHGVSDEYIVKLRKEMGLLGSIPYHQDCIPKYPTAEGIPSPA